MSNSSIQASATGSGAGRDAHRRHRRWLAMPAAVLSMLALGACATSPDPADGGFISGVVGLAGGGYERRVSEREDAYEDELDAQAALQAEARAVEQERAEVRAQLRSAQGRLAAQQRRIAAERRSVGAARGADARARLQRLDQAQAKLDATSAAVETASRGDQPVSDLKVSARAIEDDLARIDDLVGVVAGEGF